MPIDAMLQNGRVVCACKLSYRWIVYTVKQVVSRQMSNVPNQDPSKVSPVVLGLTSATRLGDFEVTGIVGRGGFSVVYAGWDHSLERAVAIKEYMPRSIAICTPDGAVVPEFPKDAETFQAGVNSFLKEARLLAKFIHPALVQIFRVWEENCTAYMAMQYCIGKTLREISQSAPETVKNEEWLKITFAPILDALDLLHSQNCFHRDISPDNILILESGGPILLDFGAARQIIGDMTEALTVVLKPGFAPIEQYANDATSLQQGPWTDIYGVGAVLYYLIMGKPPVASIARLVKDPMAKWADSTELAGMSHSFLEAIDRALAVQPSQRIQSIAELREALQLPTFKPDRQQISKTFGTSAPIEIGKTDAVKHPSQVVPINRSNPAKDEQIDKAFGSLAETLKTTLGESKTLESTERRDVEAPQQLISENEKNTDQTSEAFISNLLGESTSLGSSSADENIKVLQRPVSKPEDKQTDKAPYDTFAEAIETIPEKSTPDSIEPDDEASDSSLNIDIKFSALRKNDVEAKKVIHKSLWIRVMLLGAGLAVIILVVALSFLYKPVTVRSENQHIIANQSSIKNVSKLPSANLSMQLPVDNQVTVVLPKVANSTSQEIVPKPVASQADMSSIAVVPQPAPISSNKTSIAHLFIKPWGEVTVDGQSAGVSPPLNSLSLTPGQHVILITNGDYPPIYMPVNISEGKDTVLSYEFE